MSAKKSPAKPPQVPTAGRPKGARKQEYPQSIGELTRCRKCDSTERTKYTTIKEMAHAGERDGKPYTRVVWRHTACASCGQVRIDQHYENSPAPAAKPKRAKK
jgi:hypothetical protein